MKLSQICRRIELCMREIILRERYNFNILEKTIRFPPLALIDWLNKSLQHTLQSREKHKNGVLIKIHTLCNVSKVCDDDCHVMPCIRRLLIIYMYISVYSSMLGDTDYQTYVCPQSNSITILYQINMSYHCFEVTLKFERPSPIRIWVIDIFFQRGLISCS
jgi:hypothetical protein